MSNAIAARFSDSHRAVGIWLVGLFLLLCRADRAATNANDKQKGPRPIGVGKLDSTPGSLLVRGKSDQPWRVLKKGAVLRVGEELVALPATEAVVDMEHEGLRLTLMGGLPGLASSSPSRECVIRLARDSEGRVELVLGRGRLSLVRNKKGEGTHRLRVRVDQEVWDLTLDEPGTEVYLERLNGWPAGVPLPTKADVKIQPQTDAFLFVNKGRLELRTGTDSFALRPNGLYHWSSARGAEGPLPLEGGLSAFLKATDKEPESAAAATLKQIKILVTLLRKEPVPQALKKAYADAEMRRAAVYCAGALGDSQFLLSALQHEDPQVRETALVTLRHWLAQHGEHGPQLYQALLGRRKTPAQAGTYLYLLQSFSPRDRTRPETYDTLIAYLQHGELGIRELARWQLVRLVPKGRDIPYDAAASTADRATAQAAWRKLIPEGTVP
jgi:hypothetical protein